MRGRCRGIHADENWYEYGDLPHDLAIDTEPAGRLGEGTREMGFTAKGVDYDDLPIDADTIVPHAGLDRASAIGWSSLRTTSTTTTRPRAGWARWRRGRQPAWAGGSRSSGWTASRGRPSPVRSTSSAIASPARRTRNRLTERDTTHSEIRGPAVFTCSSETAPEFREYERTSTTVIAAYVQPVISEYLERFERHLASRGFSGSFSLMQSNGGRLPSTGMRRNPVTALFSGPAAGVMGAVRQSVQSGFASLITFDMGGTSTDVCLIHDGEPELTGQSAIDGLPVRTPLFDIVSVGAGCGSIVWRDEGGMLRVGPQSAGADPGPACYGRGGDLPTITDAHIIQGTIRPDAFLGGAMSIDEQASHRVFEDIAGHFGLPLPEMADSAIRVADANIVRAMQHLRSGRLEERGRRAREPHHAEVLNVALNPADYAVISQALIAATHEMGAKLVRSAYSTIVREASDASAALLDPNGQAVAQAELMIQQLGSLSATFGPCAEHHPVDTLVEGDFYINNDPYHGGQHLPDVFIFSPVFFEGELVAFGATVAHHIDIGGGAPGLNVNAREIYQEGLIIPPSRYNLDDDWNGGRLERLIATNVRVPDQTIGDMNAQFAGNAIGAARVRQLCRKYGPEAVRETMASLIDYSERRMRAAIAAAPDGVYHGEDVIDNDWVGGGPVHIRVAVTIDGDEVAIDFDGTSDQVGSNMNAPFASTVAAAFAASRPSSPARTSPTTREARDRRR